MTQKNSLNPLSTLYLNLLNFGDRFDIHMGHGMELETRLFSRILLWP